MSRFLCLCLVICTAVLLAACGEKKEDTSSDASETPTATKAARVIPAKEIAAKISKSTGSKPEVPALDGDPPSKLETVDIVKGKGIPVKAGEKVKMQYVGVAWSTGKEFDASWNRGEPFAFKLGQGEVIPGWDKGIVGMRRGGRRLLVIPAELGYGAQGTPDGAIGPNETLLFVVDRQ